MVSQALLSAIKTTTFWALYLGFAATSFLFVEKTILEYLEGNTDYHTTKSEVTAEDIPTFTICLDPASFLEILNQDSLVKVCLPFEFVFKLLLGSLLSSCIHS